MYMPLYPSNMRGVASPRPFNGHREGWNCNTTGTSKANGALWCVITPWERSTLQPDLHSDVSPLTPVPSILPNLPLRPGFSRAGGCILEPRIQSSLSSSVFMFTRVMLFLVGSLPVFGVASVQLLSSHVVWCLRLDGHR
jgi:hypothetical protein